MSTITEKKKILTLLIASFETKGKSFNSSISQTFFYEGEMQSYWSHILRCYDGNTLEQQKEQQRETIIWSTQMRKQSKATHASVGLFKQC